MTQWIRKTTRESIYNRDAHTCVYCGRDHERLAIEGSYLTLDHVIPRSRGGSNAATNLVTACVDCNTSKWDALLSLWGTTEDRRNVRNALRRVVTRVKPASKKTSETVPF